MKKPWEEEWAPGDGVLHTVDTRIAVFEPIERPHEPLSAEQKARARLAAAAPDMARVLIEIEWSDDGIDWQHCPSCRGLKPGANPRAGSQGHTSDCVLVDALRKAGVR